MAVVIPIVTEFVGKGVERALKEFKQLDGVAAKAGFVFQRALVPGAIAAAGAITGLGATMFKAAQAAAEAQKEDKLLADQLQRTTGATDAAIAATLEFVDALELETTISGGALSQALGTLTRATGNVTTAQDLLTLATDVAVGANQDLQSVSLALAKAYGGEFSALKKLGIPIDENTIKTKDYAKVQELLNKQFGGAAAGAADTFEGKLARLKIGFDKMIEALGEVILPLLEKFVDILNEHVVPAVQVFVDRLTKGDSVKDAFEIAIGSMDKFAPAAIQAMRSATDAVFEMIKAIALSYAGIQALIGAAQALATRGKAGLPSFAAALAAAGGAAITDVMRNKTNAYFDGLLSRLDDLKAKADASKESITVTADRLDRLEQALKPKPEEDPDDPTGSGSKFDKLAEKAKKLAERTKEAADALRTDMAEALAQAQENLAAAQESFDNFAGSVSASIKSALNFGDAAKNAGDDFGKGFLEELEEQAQNAKKFGGLVEQLIAQGISKEALDMVLAEGAESGAAIADALLTTAGGVLKANTLVEQTQAIADKIGLASADKFYKAGLDNGKAYLKGVEDAIAQANAQLATAVRPADVKGTGALFAETVGAVGTATGTTNVYNIQAQNLNPKEAGDVIVDALKEYNRRSGPLQLQIE